MKSPIISSKDENQCVLVADLRVIRWQSILKLQKTKIYDKQG